MSQTNYNFDNLWASLKDSIREQRGERKGINTFGETGINTVYGGHLQVGKIGKMSDKPHGYLHFGQAQINGIMCLHREDLMALAAQCLGAVADMDEQSNTTKP